MLGEAVRSDMLAGVIAVSPVLTFGDVTLRRSGISSVTEPVLIVVDDNDSTIFAVEDLKSWELRDLSRKDQRRGCSRNRLPSL